MQVLDPEQFDQNVSQFGFAVGYGDADQPGGLAEALEVVGGAEDEQLLFVGVPVGAQPAEDARPIVESVSHDAHFRFLYGHDFAAEKGIFGLSHGLFSAD